MINAQELIALTELHLRQEEARAAKIEAEVQSLKSNVAQIDKLLSRAFDVALDDLSRQHVGADTLWQAHLSRKRSQVMSALASMRARQEAQHVELSLAFGRSEATKYLKKEEDARRFTVAKRKSQAAFDQLLVQNSAAFDRQ